MSCQLEGFVGGNGKAVACFTCVRRVYDCVVGRLASLVGDPLDILRDDIDGLGIF